MKFGICPPLGLESAFLAVKRTEEIWNAGITDAICTIFHQEGEWRLSYCHLKDKSVIVNYLSRKESLQRNGLVKTELWSHSSFRLVVSFRSE